MHHPRGKSSLAPTYLSGVTVTPGITAPAAHTTSNSGSKLLSFLPAEACVRAGAVSWTNRCTRGSRTEVTGWGYLAVEASAKAVRKACDTQGHPPWREIVLPGWRCLISFAMIHLGAYLMNKQE
jgi:hypothetical protein